MIIQLQAINQSSDYLASSTIINWQHQDILAKAHELAKGLASKTDIAKACFEFVRDGIDHSMDAKKDGISCTASEVLANGHGFCYAKSHLLVALLRANAIPAGLCYQRLTLDDDPSDVSNASYCLHGLVAVQLAEITNSDLTDNNGWYRIDPRGNRAQGNLSDGKIAINAQFTPPVEQLAFAIRHTGEADFSEIHAEPLTCVVEVLQTHSKHQVY